MAGLTGPDRPLPESLSSTAAVDRYHDFRDKLAQEGMRPVVLDYVAWRRRVRAAHAAGLPAPPPPERGPLSINLDLTTACNYACPHCIDWDSLNSPVRHDLDRLRGSLRELARRGLRSVILIGGGEPTLHPAFADTVLFLKDLGLQVAVVTNGSRNEVIAAVADRLTAGDWVRLSLDAGSDATFQALHRPRRPLRFEAILASATAVKRRNPAVTLGFSFVITWRGAVGPGAPLVENIGEMATAAAAARAHGFDYISFKPFLERAGDGAEVLDGGAGGRAAARIRAGLAAARRHEGGGFRVIASTNLRVLLDGSWRDYTRQPRECHMQFLRQVLSPLGVFNCPAHRGVTKARIGGPESWADGAAAAGTAALLDRFDASHECREVTCLYHPVNHFLEELVAGRADPEEALAARPDRADSFL
ncbi:MAG: radical SAM protein [Planctomycetota bacterium]|nr:MAG: radical SAM protein [Planctomycetota bacterium]